MTSVLDWIGDDDPEHLEDFTRLRAQQIPDRYNPEEMVDDWSAPPAELALRGAWVAAASRITPDATREQLITTKRITIFTPDADVRAGDRIRAADGALFVVDGRPEADKNPWTGWQPTLVVAVTETKG